MSKQWKPGRQTVALQPSRIRREPARAVVKVQPRSREQELWAGVIGILVLAACCAALVFGVGAITRSQGPDSSASAPKFGHCYNGGLDCVFDGDTVRIDGEKVEIAEINAPEIHGACVEESRRGIEAAVHLRDLLNGGTVTLGPVFRDQYGRQVRKLDLNGQDVGQAMIGAGLAHAYNPDPESWC